MTTTIAIVAIILGILGFIGCILPVIPGPPISWAGMLILFLWGGGTDSAGASMSGTLLLTWFAITIAVTIVDYIVPAWFTKKFGGSKYASRGALAGLLIGLFFTPVGIIIGTIAGAFLAEMLLAHKDARRSFISAFGAFCGFICGTGLKLVACGFMFYYIISFGW